MKKYEFIESPLKSFPKESGIIIEMQYPRLGMKNALNECLLREEVINKLLKAKEKLPKDLTFKILDAYRPFELQQELYDKYRNKIIDKFNLANFTKKEQDEVIKNYVSLPDKKIPPLHTTGGAVDLTLVNIKNGKEIDMGVKFDDFSDLAKTDIYEKNGMDKNIRDNRRILYYSMISAGFTNLPTEIWHYDYGDRS